MDYHKPERNLVPHPGGIAILAGLVIPELILFAITQELGILAIALTTLIAGIIGLTDDFRTLGGVIKPLLLIIAALPILILSTYSTILDFPLFGATRLTLIYPILVLIAIPVTTNTINTIDVLNGVVSGFTIIASIPMFIALVIIGKPIIAIAMMPLIFASLAFFIFHRFPSRVFPGDSGTLSLGAMFGAVAIVGGIEVIGMIAILPAILNSFFFLSSARGFVEHRKIKVRPTVVMDDGRLAAEKSREAPVTLVRLIVADGPLGEMKIASSIFKLTAFSAILAIALAFLAWVTF